MKIIVDTCVWSLAFRRRSAALLSESETALVAQLRSAIQSKEAAIIGPIRQEILSGIRDKAKFALTRGLLDPFPDERSSRLITLNLRGSSTSVAIMASSAVRWTYFCAPLPSE